MTDTATTTASAPPDDLRDAVDSPPSEIGQPETDQTETGKSNDPWSQTGAPEIRQTATTQADPVAETVATKAATPVPPVAKPAPAPRRSGSTFVGILIGAAVAAGAGYGVQRYLLPQNTFDPSALEARLTATEAEAQALRAEIARLSEAASSVATPDQALIDRIAALESAGSPDVEPLLAPLTARIDGLEANLAALANLPSETGVAPAALAALQAEVAALKSRDTGVATDLTTLATDVEARLTEAEARAAELTVQATEIATTATRNAALGQIAAALDSGLPYGAALTMLGDEPLPEVLTAHAATGLPSVDTLEAAFPDAARVALEQALRANPGENWTERVATFLRNQTGARSLAPRDGTDPDAILSRAEAALARADIASALTEIAALPPEAQTALADWTAQAQLRLDAQAAIVGLMQGAGQ